MLDLYMQYFNMLDIYKNIFHLTCVKLTIGLENVKGVVSDDLSFASLVEFTLVERFVSKVIM